MKRIICISFIFFVSNRFFVLAQSLEELEQKYEYYTNVYEKENSILDSLKSILEKRALQIEHEMKKKKPDDEKIIELRSGSATLSNTINFYQEKAENNLKNIKNVSRQLEVKYSSKIDSLKQLKKSKIGNVDLLDAEILAYTRKRLLTSPQIDILSFNPKKILEIDFNNAVTPEEKLLFKEYLRNALSEVEALLSDISKQIKESNNALLLQKKTSKFIADTEFDRDLKIGRVSKSATEGVKLGTGVTNDIVFPASEQINSYLLLINQLSFSNKPEDTSIKKFKNELSSSELDLKEYTVLLSAAEEKLEDFKLLLLNKLNSAK
ncbi:MAG: hypothetical protein HXY50_07555 [Ignavibacteriaceae bacterium]|nr:hypothetical protein [Ignavibacteriaceae bacterium]